MRTIAIALAATLLGTLGWTGSASAQTKLTVMVFPGLQNLPIYAAQDKGLFAKRGLDVDLKFTRDSFELRDGLAEGRHQIVHTAVDNAVAMVEQRKGDVVVLMGGDNSLNELFVQPEIRSYADLKGKTVVVDALDTAYAFQLYQMLKVNGVQPNEYTAKSVGGTALRLKAMTDDKANAAAAMLNMPFSVQAKRAGLKAMATATDVVGPYQGTGAFTMRAWAKGNEDTLVRYIQGYVEGLRWAMQPANKSEAVGMLVSRLKLAPDIAELCYETGADPKNGFAKDARLDTEGFKNVLKLRAELHGDWGGKPPSQDRYVDLSYYDRAMKGL
jgi:ABC-type nitrate/sulfonate/bicarbonate transport system substrate-binding protein